MKINTIFLLTVVGVFATFSLFTMSTTTNFNAVAQSNETAVAPSNETAVAPSNETAVAPSNETAVAPSNETAVAPSNTTDNNPDFNANLTAPAISSNSDATGNATFTLKDGGNTMYYVVSGNGLANITQVVVLQIQVVVLRIWFRFIMLQLQDYSPKVLELQTGISHLLIS